MPRVSILIPCKNAGPFLDECLASIAAQSLTDWECIIVDDGSVDDSRAIAQAMERSDDRFCSIINPGQGIIAALRAGYHQARGQLITRMDADDIMLPNKLESLVKVCEAHGLGTVAAGQVEYFSAGELGDGYRRYAEWLNSNLALPDPWGDIYKECVLPSPAWMAWRADLDAVGAFENEDYPEDYDLAFRMYAGGLRLAATAGIVHKWRDHGERVSRNSEVYADNRFLELKVRYFLAIDWKADEELVVWGAGRKGKAVVRLLQQSGIENLAWWTDNPNKIGHNIYGITMQQSQLTQIDRGQVIVCIANPEEQQHIKEVKTGKGGSLYWFC